MSQDALVLLKKFADGVAHLIFNHPPLNLMSADFNRQLDRVLDEIAIDAGIRAVVVTGAGEKAFCAGSDIKEFPGLVREGTHITKKLDPENQLLDKLSFLPQPTIAALNGVTLGGGGEVALCCDLRIMGESGRIGFPEIKLGLFPGSGGLVRLPRLVGDSRAKELMFFGELITAHKALAIGLVNEVVPDGKIVERAHERAAQLANLSAQAIQAIKLGVNQVRDMPHQQGIRFSLELSRRIFLTDNAKEGIQAFFEKRKPTFNA
ncbi:MAG TPA: enoyl-CoA hydratase-related protein [Bacilli bacterium]